LPVSLRVSRSPAISLVLGEGRSRLSTTRILSPLSLAERIERMAFFRIRLGRKLW
jgi:hypothetical protein